MSISRDIKTVNESGITIYTDGCRKKTGDGGWSAIIIGNGFVKLLGGYKLETTNNKMELSGPIASLAAVSHIRSSKKLFTDSMYCVDGFNSWMHKWIRKSWTLKKDKPVKNLPYWKRLYDLKDNVKFFWVRSHNGHIENELCDSVANICCLNKIRIDESFYNIEELKFYVQTFAKQT